MIESGQPFVFGRAGIARASVTFDRDIINAVGDAEIAIAPKTATDRKQGFSAWEIGVHLDDFILNRG